MKPTMSASHGLAVVRSTLIPLGLLTLFFVLPFRGSAWVISAVLGLIAAVAAVPITVRRIKRIRRSDQPMVDALEAISLLASMVIVGFATGYYAIATHSDQIPAMHSRVDALYFTVTTMATVGFGDIVPTGQQARVLVTLQILVNLTLLAGSFRLVSGAARERRLASAP